MQDNSAEFAKSVSSPTGCIGILDGLAIKIQELSIDDVQLTYKNRNEVSALNIIRCVRSLSAFFFVSVVTPGSSYDYTAYMLSSLYKLIEGEKFTLSNGM